jgi:hypothetical protein
MCGCDHENDECCCEDVKWAEVTTNTLQVASNIFFNLNGGGDPYAAASGKSKEILEMAQTVMLKALKNLDEMMSDPEGPKSVEETEVAKS